MTKTRKKFRDEEEQHEIYFYLQWIVQLYRKAILEIGEDDPQGFTLKELATFTKHPDKIMAHDLFYMMKFLEAVGVPIPKFKDGTEF